MPGTTEIIIIAAVVLVLFGSTAIPKFARSLGKARKEFEAGVKEGMKDDAQKPGETGQGGREIPKA
jgi:sec-independent protein translocase protein TatA